MREYIVIMVVLCIWSYILGRIGKANDMLKDNDGVIIFHTDHATGTKPQVEIKIRTNLEKVAARKYLILMFEDEES